MIFGILFSNIFIFHTFAENFINISPVVQIVSYSDLYGKIPQMTSWGSATIINKNGVIISNDHVVDNWYWGISSAFSICMTKEIGQPPECNYTASLIARDDDLDISILKIDEFDVYSNAVDYSKMKSIDIDFDYIPKNQDETIAIGYPWIGSDTISETKWIVAGITQYNGYTFIKTDTLIASWNSGGAFIKNEKLIWIPTFWIGWWEENIMWYALLISEAKDFINNYKDKTPLKNELTESIDFARYKRTIQQINNNRKLQDDIFNIILPKEYQVTHYIENKTITIELQKHKTIWVKYFSIILEKAPKMSDDISKMYYFETKELYLKADQKLVRKIINGIEYFSPVDKSDISQGNSNEANIYFAIENGYLITMYLEASFYDEKRNKEIVQETEKLLHSIKINKNNFWKISSSFTTNIPKIEIKSFQNSIVDAWTYKLYLWNLYDNFEIILDELDQYDGKWKTVDEIYNAKWANIDDSLKSKIVFKWLDWFIYCWNSQEDISQIPSTDEKGNPIPLETCRIHIYFPFNTELNRHYYLSLKLTSLKNNTKKNLWIAIAFLKKYVKIDWISDEINIPNILKNQIELKFKDIWNQTTEYKNFLKLLVTYNMIENVSYFNWDEAITWGSFLEIYMKNIYNFDVTWAQCRKKDYKCKFIGYKLWDKSLDIIFQELWIWDYNEYIDTEKMAYFDTILNYKLALGQIGNGTLDEFLILQNLINEKQNILFKEKINNFNHNIYWNEKILLRDFYLNYSSAYFTIKTPRFYPDFDKIVYIKDDSLIHFGSKKNPDELELLQLSQELEDQYYFTPLTKAEAIEHIFTQVDFWMFNQKLESLKGTNIE